MRNSPFSTVASASAAATPAVEPTVTPVTPTAATSTASPSSLPQSLLQQQQQQQQQQPLSPAITPPHYNLSQWPRSLRWLFQLSQQRDAAQLVKWIEQQRNRYDQLVATSTLLQDEGGDDDAADTDENPHQETDNDQTNLFGTESQPPALVPEGGSGESASLLLLMDPLTALVQEQEAREKRLGELELKYRKEKARQKRGLQTEPRQYHESGDDEDDDADDEHRSAASIQLQLLEMRNVLDKDLHRLPPEHAAAMYSTPRRSHTLRQVLLIHAQEHLQLGYRQGMHEIGSYLLMVLEQDVYEYQQQQQQQQQPSSPSFTIPTELQSLRSSQQAHLAQDTFIMLEIIMQWLGPAYDVAATVSGASPSRSTTSSSSSSKPRRHKPPMEHMATSVLTKVQQVDAKLYHHLQRLQVPPQLYMTRWIRLMFAREVAQPPMVGFLWDVFMDLQHANLLRELNHNHTNNNYNTINNNNNNNNNKTHTSSSQEEEQEHVITTRASQLWMNLLETCAASLILLQRPLLLPTPVAGRPPMETEDSIHILMNIPTMTDLTPLTTLLRHWITIPHAADAEDEHDHHGEEDDMNDPIKHIPALLASLLPLITTTTTTTTTTSTTAVTSPGRSLSATHPVGAAIVATAVNSYKNDIHPSRTAAPWPLNGNPTNDNSKKSFSFSAVRQSLRAAAAPAGESILRFYQDWAPPPPPSSTAGSTTSLSYPTTTTTATDAALFPPFTRSASATTMMNPTTTPMKQHQPTPPSSLPVWEDPLLRPPVAAATTTTLNNPLIVDFQTPRRSSHTAGPTTTPPGSMPPQQLHNAFSATSWQSSQQQQQEPLFSNTPLPPPPPQHSLHPALAASPGYNSANHNNMTSASSSWGTTGATIVKLPATPSSSHAPPHQQQQASSSSSSASPPKPTLRHQLVLYAQQLENSVKILQDYCMEQQKQQGMALETVMPGTTHGTTTTTATTTTTTTSGGNVMVPPQVWEALVDVDHVRKGLVEVATASKKSL